MADTQLINIGFVVLGGFMGSALLTIFPYFLSKNDLEKQKEDIRKKAPEARTPEENYLLDAKSPGFFEEYKFRFTFGIISGIGSVLAFLQAGLGDVGNLTSGAALFSGITASGFFSALADKIRSTK